MNHPNFFIIGAPKSGTTSLYNYLSEHPNVYMSKIKGPHYFASDLNNKRRLIKTKKEYLDLFKDAKENHFCLGEASVLYLYSKNAIKQIHKNYPESKLIIVIRNPIDVVQSWHAEKVWGRNEDIEDIEIAWEMDKNRKLNEKKYKEDVFDYSNIAMFGNQVSSALNYFPKEQIKIINFDDFVLDTKNIYKDVINFLSLPYHNKSVFPINNAYKKYRIKWVQNFLTHPPKLILFFLDSIKAIFHIKRLNFMKNLIYLNTYTPPKPVLSDKFNKTIIKNYHDDICKLSKILNKDFIKLWFLK